MTNMIPAAVVAAMAGDRGVRAEALAMHMLMQQTVVLLIRQLHERGLVDAARLAADLEAEMLSPEVLAEMPALEVLAPVAAQLVRQEALAARPGPAEPAAPPAPR